MSQRNLHKRFEVIDIGESQSMVWLEFIPRDEESQFTRLLIAFAGKDLRRMEIIDKFGQVSRFQFFDIQRNPILEKGLFKFKAPQGFDVFGES